MKFADEVAPKFADAPTFTVGTIAWLIERYIVDMASPEMNPIGQSKLCQLLVIQRMPIGQKKGLDLKRPDVIEFGRALRSGTAGRKKPLHPCTVNGYINHVSGVFKHALSAWDDCAKLSLQPFDDARPLLQKHRVIGKADRRKRRPTDAEIHGLLNFYATPNKRGKQRTIPMPDIIATSLVSARRLGEIARIKHGDVDYEKKIYWVRDLKHPTKKKGNDKCFVLWPELEIIFKRQQRLTNNPDEPIFKFSAKSASASYTNAKNALGIEGLHFHDNRREAISKWLLKMPAEDVRVAVSGHETVKILQTVYDGRDSLELLREKYSDLVRTAA